MKDTIMYILLAMSSVGIVWYLYLNHIKWLTNFFVRSIGAVAVIYLINTITISVGLPIFVGLNLTSLLTVAFLGVPGLVLIYGSSMFF